MSYKIKNEYGVITIENEVIKRIAGYSALDCYGIVGMAAKNVKDGWVQLLKKESLTKGIRLTINENKIDFNLHIIVEYGTNIAVIADSTINTIRYKVEDYLGIKVSSVNIFVEGVRVD